MQSHLLTIRYTGLLADSGVMVASHAEKSMRGARWLLAASAYQYTRGECPFRLHSQTDDFQIVEFASRDGSLVRELLVGIAGSAVYDIGKVYFPDVLIAGVALGALALARTKKSWWIEMGQKLKQRFGNDKDFLIL